MRLYIFHRCQRRLQLATCLIRAGTGGFSGVAGAKRFAYGKGQGGGPLVLEFVIKAGFKNQGFEAT